MTTFHTTSVEELARRGRIRDAAPDLYEALLRLKTECEAEGLDKKAGFDCWISMANQALAKATTPGTDAAREVGRTAPADASGRGS